MIHPSAIIEDGAEIAKDVSIAPFCHIGSKVKILEGSVIDSHTIIEGDTTIGKNCKIFSHAVIGSIPQDLKYQGEDVKLIIGDNNIIREFTLINPGTKGGGGVTKIGDNNLLMGYVHIAHDVKIGNNCILANAATLAGHVELGDYVVIGGMTPIHQFVKIGNYAMIAGASALSQDIPPFCLAEGNRAVVRGLNLTGLRRNLERSKIDIIKSTYREIFNAKEGVKARAKKLLESKELEKEAKMLCQFIVESKRGIPFKRKIDA